MIHVNEHFLALQRSYLFSEIARKVKAYEEAHPQAKLIRLGIGDVTQPLPQASIEAMHKAVDEMASASTFRGYGPEQGYDFLRRAIVENDYEARGVHIDMDEVFVGDGAKSDLGNIGDIFSLDNSVGITNPVYPVYVDSNVMSGRAKDFVDGAWQGIEFIDCTAANDFVPTVPSKAIDIIYLCYPNNPTGTVLRRHQLQAWVDYAKQNKAVILYDSAYEAYIQEEDVPHSIYELEGAKEVAIEFRSFSKTAGFTGVRCGYTIVPKALKAHIKSGEEVELNALWNRRQTTKFNGTSYITQRAAEAIYSPEGKQQIRNTINYYMTNARIMKESLLAAKLKVYGGDNAPYIWVKTPEGLTSWEFFEKLLNEVNLVTTPGVGFGSNGEGYIRLTAFGSRENCVEAMERFKTCNV